MKYIRCEALLPDGSVWEDYIFPADTVPEAPESTEREIYRARDYFLELAKEQGVTLASKWRVSMEECETPEDYYKIRGPAEYVGGSPATDRLYGLKPQPPAPGPATKETP